MVIISAEILQEILQDSQLYTFISGPAGLGIMWIYFIWYTYHMVEAGLLAHFAYF